MNGPSPMYLAQLAAAMSVDPRMSAAPPPAPVSSEIPAPMMVPNPIAQAEAPAGPPPAPPAPSAAPAPTPWQPGFDPLSQPWTPATDTIESGLAQASAVNEAPAPAPLATDVGQPRPNPNEFPLVRVGGSGVIPAHEVDLRGPTLRAAQNAANATSAGAIDASGERSGDVAKIAYAQALDQERAARAREAAAAQSMAERDEELAARHADFDQSARQLSKMAIDPNRFWASRSTGQKVSAMISIALGGFLQGMRGGSNPGLDAINTAIDRDIHAQEMAYHIARDANEASRTAFGLAMQKYQNVDAARAMSRVAALDAVGAQVAQERALEFGANAANHADAMLAQLAQQRAEQLAHGIRFVLPRATGARYVDPRTGLVYSEAEAKSLAHELRGYEQKREEIGLNTAGDLMKEKAKAQVHAAQRGSEEAGKISAQLQQAGVPQARAAAEAARRALNEDPGGTGDRFLRWGLGDGEIAQKLMPHSSNAREQSYWAFANASMKAMMGNVTESEMNRAKKQLGSAHDPESRRRAIDATLQTLSEIEKNAKALASPDAQAQFEQRRERAKGQPDLLPAGADSGWK